MSGSRFRKLASRPNLRVGGFPPGIGSFAAALPNSDVTIGGDLVWARILLLNYSMLDRGQNGRAVAVIRYPRGVLRPGSAHYSWRSAARGSIRVDFLAGR